MLYMYAVTFTLHVKKVYLVIIMRYFFLFFHKKKYIVGIVLITTDVFMENSSKIFLNEIQYSIMSIIWFLDIQYSALFMDIQKLNYGYPEIK